MDSTIEDIVFDDHGICNYCKNLVSIQSSLGDEEKRTKSLKNILQKIKLDGKNNDYDCVIGISGGIDSTYLALKAVEHGLRPLAVHFDNGWNAELAVKNIENTISKLDIDLITHVVDWEEFKDLQISFFKSGVVGLEAPTDHGLRALLYQKANEYKVKHILVGTNLYTEGILPKKWGYGNGDWRYISDIHKRFGKIKKLLTYPHYSLLDLFYYICIKKIKRLSFLNYIKYNKKEALKELKRKLSYKEYDGKHYESVFTRFYQGHILPEKFQIDKRKAHLSVLVVNNIIKREKALEILKDNSYTSDMIENDRRFLIKKLDFSELDWQKYMDCKIYDYSKYKTNSQYINLLIPLYHKMKEYT